MTSNRNRAEVRATRTYAAEHGIRYAAALRLVRAEAARRRTETPIEKIETEETEETDE